MKGKLLQKPECKNVDELKKALPGIGIPIAYCGKYVHGMRARIAEELLKGWIHAPLRT
jgi:hypothetical protein